MTFFNRYGIIIIVNKKGRFCYGKNVCKCYCWRDTLKSNYHFIPLEKSIIFIVGNCGDLFKVKLYLTEEVKKLLDFMTDVNIIDFWTSTEKDIYEI